MTNTRAPAARANWTANVDVPAPAPSTSTRLPRGQPAAREERAPRGQARQRQGRSLLPAEPRGLREDAGSRDAHLLGERAVVGAAEDLEARPEHSRIVAPFDPGVDDDLVALREVPPTPEPSARTTPAPSEPGTSGSGHARPAARDHAQIAPVERGGAQVDHDLPGSGTSSGTSATTSASGPPNSRTTNA